MAITFLQMAEKVLEEEKQPLTALASLTSCLGYYRFHRLINMARHMIYISCLAARRNCCGR